MARARRKAFVPRALCSRLAAPPSRATMPSQSWVKSDSRVIPCWNHTRFLDARALLAPMGLDPGIDPATPQRRPWTAASDVKHPLRITALDASIGREAGAERTAGTGEIAGAQKWPGREPIVSQLGQRPSGV